MLSKSDRQIWITEIRRFQQIAGTPLTSEEELGAEWDSWKKDRRERSLASIKTHRTIQDVARGVK